MAKAAKRRLQIFLEPVFVKELERIATARGLIGESGITQGLPRPAVAASEVLRMVLRKSRTKRLSQKKAR